MLCIAISLLYLGFWVIFEISGEHSDFICCVKSGSLSIGVILEPVIDIYCSFIDYNFDILRIPIKHN